MLVIVQVNDQSGYATFLLQAYVHPVPLSNPHLTCTFGFKDIAKVANLKSHSGTLLSTGCIHSDIQFLYPVWHWVRYRVKIQQVAGVSQTETAITLTTRHPENPTHTIKPRCEMTATEPPCHHTYNRLIKSLYCNICTYVLKLSDQVFLLDRIQWLVWCCSQICMLTM